MRKVFSPQQQVIHVWAQQNQEYGRNSRDTLRFHGCDLQHWSTTIALHYGGLVLTAEGGQFSVTTTQLTPSSYDVSPTPCIALSDFFDWGRTYSQFSSNKLPTGGAIKKAIMGKFPELVRSYHKRRADSTRAWDMSLISSRLGDLETCCNYFKLKYPKGYTSAVEVLQTTEKVVQRLQRAELKEARRLERVAKQKRIDDLDTFNRWLDGENVQFPSSYFEPGKGYHLTIRAGRVLTSGGAECPLEHVKLGFELYDRITSANKEWKRNGERLQLGFFELDQIDKAGNVKAGCHVFAAEELARFRAKWADTLRSV